VRTARREASKPEALNSPAAAFIQRRQEHKQRNVIEHLLEELHASVRREIREAWGSANDSRARARGTRLAHRVSDRPSDPALVRASWRRQIVACKQLSASGGAVAPSRSTRTACPSGSSTGSDPSANLSTIMSAIVRT